MHSQKNLICECASDEAHPPLVQQYHDQHLLEHLNPLHHALAVLLQSKSSTHIETMWMDLTDTTTQCLSPKYPTIQVLLYYSQ